MPQQYNELLENVDKLERYFKDMEDIEFTIQDSTLYMLQTRTGKRAGLGKLSTNSVLAQY